VVTTYAIDGMAGIGKTAFARHAARELAQRYPDGARVDLYGHTRHDAAPAFRRVGGARTVNNSEIWHTSQVSGP
jgi:MoxR-like ATPase